MAASSVVGRRLFKRLCKSDYFTLSANSAPAAIVFCFFEELTGQCKNQLKC